MRFIEPISPNVTQIRNIFNTSNGDAGIIDIEKSVITLHDNGAIQIDTKFVNGFKVVDDVNKAFTEYQKFGHLYPVSVTGIKTAESDAVGSYRFCNMDSRLSGAITDILNRFGVAQYDGGNRFIRCSDYFRFMRYGNGGEHFPHYDSDFVFPNDDKKYTGYTVVMYFTNCKSGEFAFVKDNRHNHNNSDWDRQASEDEITLKILPKVGRILIFPHTLCHTVLPFTDENTKRIIARGDLIFEKR